VALDWLFEMQKTFCRWLLVFSSWLNLKAKCKARLCLFSCVVRLHVADLLRNSCGLKMRFSPQLTRVVAELRENAPKVLGVVEVTSLCSFMPGLGKLGSAGLVESNLNVSSRSGAAQS
jgi:hypothetical protein